MREREQGKVFIVKEANWRKREKGIVRERERSKRNKRTRKGKSFSAIFSSPARRREDGLSLSLLGTCLF